MVEIVVVHVVLVLLAKGYLELLKLIKAVFVSLCFMLGLDRLGDNKGHNS